MLLESATNTEEQIRALTRPVSVVDIAPVELKPDHPQQSHYQ